ncbi:MAG: hypothetical protein IJJ66_03345, partial [Treponema sp.]|nr:hypothetical protein [Treponema sp.]
MLNFTPKKRKLAPPKTKLKSSNLELNHKHKISVTLNLIQCLYRPILSPRHPEIAPRHHGRSLSLSKRNSGSVSTKPYRIRNPAPRHPEIAPRHPELDSGS